MERKEQLPLVPKQFFRTIKIIHLSLIIGVVMFMGVIFFLTQSFEFNFEETKPTFLYLIPILIILGGGLGEYLFRKRIKIALKKETLRDKLYTYQTASIIRWCLLEYPMLYGIVAYLLSTNFIFIVVVLAIMTYMVMIRPTHFHVIETLQLNAEERKKIAQ